LIICFYWRLIFIPSGEKEEFFLKKDELKKKGEEFLKKIKQNYNFFSKALEKKDDIVPVKKGEVPKLAVLLGLLDPFFYDLYNLCDGKRDLNTLSEILGIEKNDIKILIDKLEKNGLIEEEQKIVSRKKE
jgi:hypothetical protein